MRAETERLPESTGQEGRGKVDMIASQGPTGRLRPGSTSLPYTIAPGFDPSTISEMRAVGVDGKIRDLFTRRLDSAPRERLKQTFGFEEFGLRVWTHRSFFLIAAGQSEFLKRADDTFRRYRHPFPGLVDVDAPNRRGLYRITDQRLVSFVNVGFGKAERAILLKGKTSFIINRAVIVETVGPNDVVDLVIGGSSETDLRMMSFLPDIEIMLTRQLLLNKQSVLHRS